MSNRILALALAALIAAASGQAQSRVDSLESRLGVARGSERVEVLVELMRELYDADPQQAQGYGRRALSLLDRDPDPALRADVLYFLSAAHYYQDQADSALVYAEQARDLSRRAEDARLRERVSASGVQERLGQAERFIGTILHDQGRYAESEAAYLRALDVFERTGNRHRMADAVNDLAILYKTQGDFPRAVEHHRQALEVYEELGLETSVANVLHGLGIVYGHMGRYDDALDSFFKVREIWERRDAREELAGTLTNIGGVFEYLEDYEQSLTYYGRAREIYEALGRKNRLAIALTNIGSAHVRLAHYDEASASFGRARALAEEVGNERLMAYIHEGQGRLHEGQGDLAQARLSYEASLAAFERLGDRRGHVLALMAAGRMWGGQAGIAATERAVGMAREMESHLLLRDGYQQLADLYAGQGLFAEALDAHRSYKAANDSLFNARSQTTIARLQTEYRTKEHEQQIALLEHTRREQRLWVLGLLGSVGLLGAISALSLNRVRLRQRTLVALEQAHRAETEAAEAKALALQAENDRKAQELEAARRLQLSMLPKALPRLPQAELAAYMRTATEVGGDYYDFEPCASGALTIAIGDATGHGTQAGTLVAAVKGLFGTFADEPDLAHALRLSARALRRMALPQLFMAFALARLRGHTLELAGAGMPPALVLRADRGTVEQVSLKGLPLGAPADLPYEKGAVTLRPGDVVVLMSDGLPELRNAQGEELGYDRTAKALRDVGCRDPETIVRRFTETIESWTDGHPIHDDITLVVLRMRTETAS